MDSDAAWERRRRENDVQSGTTTVSGKVGEERGGVPVFRGFRVQGFFFRHKIGHNSAERKITHIRKRNNSHSLTLTRSGGSAPNTSCTDGV